jgi:hypothetical protein
MTLFAFSIPMVLYHIYGWVVPIVILAALFGLRWKVGMWGNILSLGAVLLSFLIAVGWWENLAYLLAKQAPMLLFVADCIAFFTIFLLSLLILDFATRYMSTIKVKYADTVEKVGNGVALFLLSSALYVTYLFGAGDLGAVGEHHNVQLTAGEQNPITIQALRLLSVGNLGAFNPDNVSRFDRDGNFRELHLQRRQALMLNMLNSSEGGAIRGVQGTDAQAERIEWRR